MELSSCELIPTSSSAVIKEGTLPCPCFISIVSQRHEKIDYLLFQNYYVSSISIFQINRDGKWLPILSDFKLTSFPHFENDAENWYIIPATFFNENYVPNYFKELKIYVSQPSPNWRDFSLKNISCYNIREKPVQKKNEPLSAFSKFKAQVQEKIEVLSNATGADVMSYEDTLNSVIEVTRLEVGQIN